MQPVELWRLVKAAVRRDERQRELAAWQVHYMLACWTEEPPTVNQLLGREEEPTEVDEAKLFADLAPLMRRE